MKTISKLRPARVIFGVAGVVVAALVVVGVLPVWVGGLSAFAVLLG